MYLTYNKNCSSSKLQSFGRAWMWREGHWWWDNELRNGWYIWHLDAVIAQSNHWPTQCEILVYQCISQLSFFIANYIMLSQIVFTLYCSTLISARKRVVTIISYAWLELNFVVLVKFSSQPGTPWHGDW
jgi:hypothetical protein